MMNTKSASEEIDCNRRHFLRNAAAALTAARVAVANSAAAQCLPHISAASTPTGADKRSFGPLTQIDAGALNVAYAEEGPAHGAPVILLHGWPYDIHMYVDVAPLLAASGFRVIVPY